MDLEQLYESVKPIVWLLTMEGVYEGQLWENRQTAFAVKDGLLMTCAHGTDSWSNVVVKARRLCEKTTYKAEYVVGKPDCDIVLYKVEGVVDMAIGKFGSGVLAVGEKVMCVGNPKDFVGSGMIGQVLYPCFAYPRFSFTDELTCEIFKCNTWGNTPDYRLMGHLWNESSIKVAEEEDKNDNDKRDIGFYGRLKGRLPVIQTSGLISGAGASGAPIVNLKGEIVGMHLMCGEGFEIGSHLRVLVGFLQFAANYISPPPSPSGGSMEVGETSSESKKGKKRKN